MADPQFVWNRTTGERFAIDPKSGVPVAAPEVTSIGAAAVGAGERFTELGRGFVANVADIIGAEDLREQMVIDMAADTEALEGLELSNPTARAIGNVLPDLAAGVGVGGIVRGGRNLIAAEGLLGAALGGNTLAETGGEQAFNALLGGALGAATQGTLSFAGGVASRHAQRVRGARQQRGAAEVNAVEGDVQMVRQQQVYDNLQSEHTAYTRADIEGIQRDAGTTTGNPLDQESVTWGDELGFKFTRGGRAGDQSTMNIEAGLRSNPWTSRPFDNMDQANQALLNKNVASSMGIRLTGKNGQISDMDISEAFTQVNKDFGQMAIDLGNVPLDDGFKEAIQRIGTEAAEGASFVPQKDVQRVVENILAFAEKNQVITGRDFMKQRAGLVAEMRALQKGSNPNQNTADALKEIVDVMDTQADTILASRNPGALATYRSIREKYRNLALFTRKNLITPDGNVSPGRAISAIQKEYPFEYQQRRAFDPASGVSQDNVTMMKSLRVMNSQAMRASIGNSGTATRNAVNEALSNPLNLALNITLGSLPGRAFVGAGPVPMGTLSQAVADAITAGSGAGNPVSGAVSQLVAGGAVQAGQSVQRNPRR